MGKKSRCGRRAGRAWLLGLAALATLLAGCGIQVNSAPGALPSLDAAQQARDDAARSEASTARMASALSVKATRCAPCKAELDAVRDGSQERLRALGGLWSPWASPVPDGAETPAALADAPLTPERLAEAMARSAQRDLDAVARTDAMDSDTARALTASGAGRLLAARALARVYGAGAPASGAGALNLPSDSASLRASGELSRAVRTYDCAARALYAHRSDARAEALLERSTLLFGAGVKDSRVERCRLADAGADALARAVLSADVDVASSASPAVRRIGVALVREDVGAWADGWAAPALPGAVVR